MVTAQHVADLALVAAAATAVPLAVRRRSYAPVAVYLPALVLADGVRRGLANGVLADPGPYTGVTRAAFHVEEALFLGSLFGFAALVSVLFASVLPPRAIAGAYAAALAVLVATYPAVRGELLARVYLGVDLAALAVSAAAVIQWGWRWQRPRLEHAAGLMVVAIEVAKLAGGPWRVDLVAGWQRAWPMHAVLYGALTMVQVAAMFRGGGSWTTR